MSQMRETWRKRRDSLNTVSKGPVLLAQSGPVWASLNQSEPVWADLPRFHAGAAAPLLELRCVWRS